MLARGEASDSERNPWESDPITQQAPEGRPTQTLPPLRGLLHFASVSRGFVASSRLRHPRLTSAAAPRRGVVCGETSRAVLTVEPRPPGSGCQPPSHTSDGHPLPGGRGSRVEEWREPPGGL